MVRAGIVAIQHESSFPFFSPFHLFVSSLFTTMLCIHCSKLFEFSNTPEILDRKLEHFLEAKVGRCRLIASEAEIDLQRYRTALKLRSSQKRVPCPWNADYPSIKALQRFSERLPYLLTWGKLRANSISTSCGFCRTLVAIIESSYSVLPDKDARFLIQWLTSAGQPLSLRCRLLDNDDRWDQTSLPDLHCAVENVKVGGSTVFKHCAQKETC
jgi:hypothetical protein